MDRRSFARAALVGGVAASAERLSAQRLPTKSSGVALAEIAFRPLGNNQDDAPRLSQIAATYAGQQPVRLLPGLGGEPWLIMTTWQMPSYLTLRGTDQTTIVQKLPFGSGNALQAGLAASGKSNANAQVAANAVFGSQQLIITKSVAIGTYIAVIRNLPGGFRQATYRVLGISGSGPYTLTLDHSVHYAFQTGDAVTIMNAPVLNICIEGNGMTMAGTGSRYIELIHSAVNCYVSDINFSSSEGNVSERLMSFDEAAYNCHAEGLVGDGGSVTTTGYSFEGAENCSYKNCRATQCVNAGFLFQDGVYCSLINDSAYSNGIGASFTSASNVEGANFNQICGGDYSGNYAGIQINNGSSQNCIVDASACLNTSAGVQLTAGSFSLTDNYLYNLLIIDNPGPGIYLSSSSVGTVIEQCLINGSKNPGILVPAGATGTRILSCEVDDIPTSIAADCEIVGLRGTASVTALTVLAGGYARVCGLDLTAPSGSGVNVVQVAGVAEFQNAHVTIGTNGNAFVAAAGGVIKVSHTKIDKSADKSTVGLFSETGGTIRIGDGVDVDNTSAPLYGSGFFSRNTVVMADASGTPQDFAWPDIKSTDRVLFRLVTAAGTPAPAAVTYTITAGFKVTVTFAPQDGSTYEVIIV